MTIATAAPVADWVDALEMWQDPYPTYKRLRQESPVAWAPALNFYLATTYDACKRVANDTAIFGQEATVEPMERSIGGVPMVAKEGAAHRGGAQGDEPGGAAKLLEGTLDCGL